MNVLTHVGPALLGKKKYAAGPQQRMDCPMLSKNPAFGKPRTALGRCALRHAASVKMAVHVAISRPVYQEFP
jgi:hypothetical protein